MKLIKNKRQLSQDLILDQLLDFLKDHPKLFKISRFKLKYNLKI